MPVKDPPEFTPEQLAAMGKPPDFNPAYQKYPGQPNGPEAVMDLPPHAHNPHAYTQVSQAVDLPAGKPGKGWVWSKRLNKWRRPAIRQWMNDRQGIHAILGFAVGLSWLLLLFDPLLMMGPVIAAQLLAYIRFNRYEEVEAKEIGDDGYIDLGGELMAWLPTTAVCLAVVGCFGL